MTHRPPRRRPSGRGSSALAGGVLALLLTPLASRAEDATPAISGKGDVPARRPLEEVVVTARRLDEARDAIAPQIGASSFSFSRQTIENEPGGDNVPLNQVILQAPGVAQDSFGQIHVRNDHANLQYRINGTILPEGISFFGQSLSPRFAEKLDLVTGTLPAQYGLRTAGIINITTKGGAFDQGGAISFYGGSHGWVEPSAELMGSSGSINYYVAGDYLANGLGIEAPTRARNPLHDDTQQGHGFAYLSDTLDDNSRLSLILGTYRGQFQIPNIPGQIPANTVNGSANFDSATLDENQRELNHYGVVSYLKTGDKLDFQLSLFTRYSSLTFRPDPFGDLAFNGIAQDAYRRSFASGVQADGSWRILPDHTLRGGFSTTGERTVAKTQSLVELTGGSDTPFTIASSGAKTGWTYSLYLQDEWQVTDALTLNFGARFDSVDAITHENQISPRLNAVYKLTDRTILHAGYARYFTPPPFETVSLTDVTALAPTTGASPGTGNAPVRAERSDYLDIGISQQFLPGLNAGIDLYYKHAHNLIDEGQFGAPIILVPFNYRVARNYGVELTTSYDTGNFSFFGNLAIAQQKAKDIVSAQYNFTPDDLDFIRSHAIHTDHDQLMTASAGASYHWRQTRFSLEVLAGSGLRKSVTGPNQQSVPSYEQVNLGVSQRVELPGAGTVDVRGDIINLLDESYQIRDGTGIGVGAPQFGARRGFFAGITKQF